MDPLGPMALHGLLYRRSPPFSVVRFRFLVRSAEVSAITSFLVRNPPGDRGDVVKCINLLAAFPISFPQSQRIKQRPPFHKQKASASNRIAGNQVWSL